MKNTFGNVGPPEDGSWQISGRENGLLVGVTGGPVYIITLMMYGLEFLGHFCRRDKVAKTVLNIYIHYD